MMNHATTCEIVWQQWIRLEASYHEGLYYSYEFPEIEKTNNATEQLINQIKRHFKKWMGQQDFHRVFQDHSEAYSQLIELDYSDKHLHEVLWKQSIAIAEGFTPQFGAFQATLKRKWRIREHVTGNMQRLRRNLQEIHLT